MILIGKFVLQLAWLLLRLLFMTGLRIGLIYCRFFWSWLTIELMWAEVSLWDGCVKFFDLRLPYTFQADIYEKQNPEALFFKLNPDLEDLNKWPVLCNLTWEWRWHLMLEFVVHGALRCLALLSGDLDDTVVPTLVPVLFPCLLTILSSPQVRSSSHILLLFPKALFDCF